MRHPAFQRGDMGSNQGLRQFLVAMLYGIDDAAAGLRLDIHPDGAEGKFALEGAALHRGGRGEEGDVLHRDLSWRGVVAPLPLGQRLD